MRRLALGLLLLLWPGLAAGAVTFDSTFEKGVTGQSTPFSYAVNAGDVVGQVSNNANRVLVLIASFSQSVATIGTVTTHWDSTGTNQAGVAVGVGVDTGAGAGSVFMFRILAPTVGSTLTVRVDWTGGASAVILGGLSLYDVDQTTPISNNSSDAGSGTSASSTVTTTTGGLAVAGHVNVNGDGNLAITAPATSAWINTANANNHAAGYRPDNAGSTVIAWTWSPTSVGWANIKANVQTTSGTGAPQRTLLGVGQ